ncbi:hypothetical protein DB347_13530 [Opitutaceae bacterium EW11]|nr:hypothetical protein DB347_13530 [Opitutaceae bacterium EW11]
MKTTLFVLLLLMAGMLRLVAQPAVDSETSGGGAGASRKEVELASRLFLAQQSIRNRHTPAKEAESEARRAREAAETKRQSFRNSRDRFQAFGLQKLHLSGNQTMVVSAASKSGLVLAPGSSAEFQARKAYLEAWEVKERAEIEAELKQIAFEESVLDEAVRVDPALAAAVELQRRDIAARKKTLAARSEFTGRVPPEELTDP